MSISTHPWQRRDTVICDETSALVETSAGKVRGYIQNGIYTFKGIPYGAGVSGDARFKPAEPPIPWTGVRPCLTYGSVCPQVLPQPIGVGSVDLAAREDMFLLQRAACRPVGEDCLVLNIWTPEINSSSRLPVMLWLHGGAFSLGFGHDLLAYDGENLAHKGAVVVTLNHRLGIFGHLNLAQLGDERYAASGNIASLDHLLALRWVRANIARFGGDPNLVTIFGQSGGGGKVLALLGMPSAKGTFQRAVVQSYPLAVGASMEGTTALARAVLEELGIAPGSLDELHALPVEHILAAGNSAMARLKHHPLMGWNPVADGVILPETSFEHNAPEVSRDVPLLIGSNYHELCNGVDNPTAYQMTDEQAEARLGKDGTFFSMLVSMARLAGYPFPVLDTSQEHIRAMLAASRKVFPDLAPFDRYAFCGNWFRPNVQHLAERKAAQGGAPAYYYLFNWRTPVLNGRPGAFHSCEISFVFNNADKYACYNGGGEAPLRLADQMSDAWLAFARTGNPNHPGLPAWPAYEPDKGATMVFDAPCKVETAPDLLLQRAMEESGQ